MQFPERQSSGPVLHRKGGSRITGTPRRAIEMTKILTLTTAAMLLAGVSVASAQHQPTTNVSPPPNSINKGSRGAGATSGAESSTAANPGMAARVMGHSKYCTKSNAGGATLHCRFASLKSCKQHGVHGGLECVVNPSIATTGNSPTMR
jgi:hypothetical protein